MIFTQNKLVLIVGCSVRAAAWSARRAGLRVVAVDQFGDSDLLEICEQHERVEEDRWESVESLLNQDDVSAWFYTGGLENRPDLLRQWAELKPLWGNPEEVVRNVRDPFQLHYCLQKAGFPCLQVRSRGEQLSTQQDWLCKPLRSGGGIQVHYATSTTSPNSSDFYFQEYRAGIPISLSGVVVRGEFQSLGYARQWINSEVQNGGAGERLPFLFCGGVVLDDLPADSFQQTQNIARIIVQEFGLVGLVGFDFILDDRGEACLLEVNPRYTATMELLERKQGGFFISLLADSFGETDIDQSPRSSNSGPLSFAKRIVYAAGPFQAPERKFWEEWRQDEPEVVPVDLPQPGSVLAAGEPVCSLILRGTSESLRINPIEAIVGRFQQRLQEQTILLDGSEK